MGPEKERWRFVAVTRQGDSHTVHADNRPYLPLLLMLLPFWGFCAVERPHGGNVARPSLLYRLNTHREITIDISSGTGLHFFPPLPASVCYCRMFLRKQNAKHVNAASGRD